MVPTVEDWRPYRDAWDQMYAAIWDLREGRPTILRAQDVWNPFLAQWRKAGIEPECTATWEMQAHVVREAAEANTAVFVSAFEIDVFERSLGVAFLRLADNVPGAVDAAAVARRVAREHPRRRTTVLRGRATVPRLAWALLILAGLLAALVGGAVSVEGPPQHGRHASHVVRVPMGDHHSVHGAGIREVPSDAARRRGAHHSLEGPNVPGLPHPGASAAAPRTPRAVRRIVAPRGHRGPFASSAGHPSCRILPDEAAGSDARPNPQLPRPPPEGTGAGS